MSEFFSFTSTTVSDETDPMKMEIERLKTKSSQDNAKIKALKKQVSDLTLKIQLLEEENKLLQATRVALPPKPQENIKMVPQSKVTEVLIGFDQILEQNSKEINALLSNRDRLSNVCFNSLALISTQELYIQKFKSSTQKLLRFFANNNESMDSVIKDFKSLGIDVSSELNAIKKQSQVNNFVSNITIDTTRNVDSNEIQQILQMLPQMQINDSSMKTIAQYILQQVNRDKEAKKSIDDLKIEKEKIEQDYQKLLTKLCAKSKKVNLKYAMEQIELYSKNEKQTKSLENMITSLVHTFAQFGNRFGNDSDTQRCLNRINFWLQGSAVDIDIVQEIDFLLGMCLTERKSRKGTSHCYNEDYPNRHKNCMYEKNMIRQVKQLKESVIDMKGRLEDVNRSHYRKANY